MVPAGKPVMCAPRTQAVTIDKGGYENRMYDKDGKQAQGT
jgi:hypothetical protein